VLLVDFVNTGATFSLLARRLRALEVRLAPRAIAAMAVLPEFNSRDDRIVVKPLMRVDRQTVLPSSCLQCQLGIPYTDPWSEEYLTIRTFDFWDMMLSFKWRPETFGPKSARLFRETPDLENLFERYGDWLAYKIDIVLTYIGVQNEVVVVCPDEPIVNRLMAKLRPRFQQRLVAIHIPRNVLDLIGAQSDLTVESVLRTVGDEGNDDGWLRQLRYLASHRSLAHIAVIDEFNASGTTAKAILALLHEFGLRPTAYIPVINWDPVASVPGSVPVYPLYHLPRAREN
jgi:hypothetical protein